MGKQRKHVRKSKRGLRFLAGRRRVVKASKSQSGKSNIKIDMKLSAMLPGKRQSGSGKIYFEKRKNRSDLRGRV